MKALARYALGTRTQALARIADPHRKIAVLLAGMTALEAIATDDVIDTMLTMIAASFTRTERQGQTARLRTIHDLDAAALVLHAVCQLLFDPQYADADVRSTIFTQLDPTVVQQAMTTIQQVVHPKHEPFDQQLIHQYPQIRRWLPTLLDTVTFHGLPTSQPLLKALAFIRALDQPTPPKLHHAPTEVVGARWRRLVINSGQVVDRTLYTCAVLDRLQQSLDRREVFVEPSERWSDPRAHLISAAVWQQQRSQWYRTLGRNPDPHAELALLDQQLTDAYRHTATRLASNDTVRLEHINGHDRPIITGLERVPEPASLRTLRLMTQQRMPDVDLPDLLLEIHAITGFADAFTHLSEQGTRVQDLPLSVCAVLLAEACNIGIEPLVQPTIPALTRDRLTWVQQQYVRPETMARANARLVTYQQHIPITTAWGGGDVASVDGMRFVVPVRTIHAGKSPKHFPRERGLTWYNGVSDQHMGFNAIVIPGALRDAPYLLNVLLEQPTHLQIREVMTDTAGYSDIVFGVFWLLGYQFSPRLADLKDMRFWHIDPTAEYGALNDVGRHRINTAVIHEHWDEMMRLAGSLKQGTVTGDAVVRWLHGDKRPRSLARSVAELGRIAKTLYLLAYMGFFA